MPPKSTSLTASVDPVCNSCGTNTGLDRIDATKINGLLDIITSRLSSDVFGNWFIEGAKGKDSRLGQLTEITSLKGELEAFKTSIDKYIALHEPKEVEKPVNMNKGMRATVDKMVEEKLSKEIQGLKEEVKQLREAEAARKTVEDRSKINGKAVPGSGSYGPFPKAAKHDDCPANTAINKLAKRIDTVVKDQAALKEQVDRVDSRATGQGVTLAALDLWKKRKDAQQSKIVSDVAELQAWKPIVDASIAGSRRWDAKTATLLNIITSNLRSDLIRKWNETIEMAEEEWDAGGRDSEMRLVPT
ncbi:hypothetical protein LTR56_005765 [Elasticomyces elasticus]|nr:hypothetical protein LTR56_005765 [Elasticomyces elasticus]KAK3657437.1 hypothetical protein LTR22_009303 [Elasticomyces elasticus]KAK4925696.1 hypothetical protein LTR49_007306 [Elasticomyces elasticus]KAK5765027.1 hypothetical protein LTS12_004805 [Elasticomyces elasticus]